MEPRWFVPIVLLVLLLSGAVLFRALSHLLRRLRLRMRFARGARGECKARNYLSQHGFRILKEQASLTPWLFVDGKRVPFEIRADFIVSKRGRRAVVDAKTGTVAIDPRSPHTRRQLLEYAHYYDVDDVYLFDAEHKRLLRIGFGLVGRNSFTALAGLLCGMALGGAGVYVWMLMR